jgi:hypothetical protein
MSGELRRLPAGPRGDGQRVPASRVSDYADHHDLFQLAAAVEPHRLVGARKGGGKSIATDRHLARTEKHDVFRHQSEQTDKIAGVDRIDPG